MAQRAGERTVTTSGVEEGDAALPTVTAVVRQRRRWSYRPDRVDGVLAAAIAVGTGLRFWGIGNQSLWYDEWLTAEAASGSLSHLVRYVAGSAGIPPTYFGFMWIWARIIGDGDAALRTFSALVGIVTIPMAYAVTVELRQSRLAARSGALLVAVNPMLVWYSQEARPYTLVAFLGTLSLWALARLWTRGRRADLTLWVLVCALTVAVHYFAVFLVAAEALALLIARRDEVRQRAADWRSHRLDRREWLVAFVPTWIVLGALAPFAGWQFLKRGNHDWIADYGLRGRLHGAGTAALVGPSPPSWAWLDGWVWLVGFLLVALAGGVLLTVGNYTERRGAGAAGGLVLATLMLALAAAAIGIDAVIERYLIVALVPLLVGIAAGFGVSRMPSWLAATSVVAACVVSILVVVTVNRDPQLQRADWRAVAEAHDAAEIDGTRLLVVNTQGYLGQPLLRYLDDAERLDRDESVTVERIDFVVALPSDQPCNGFVGLECNMIFLGVPGDTMILGPLAPYFQLDERVELDQFAVERYVATRPVSVTPEDIVPRREDGKWPGLVLATYTASSE